MTEPTREQALAHFGVKGMRWGVTSKSSAGGSSSKPSRAELKEKNKAAASAIRSAPRPQVQKAKSKRDAEILKARTNLGKAAEDYRTAKQSYKTQKQEIGKVAAKHALRQAGDQYLTVRNNADKLTDREKSIANSIAVGEAIASIIGGQRIPAHGTLERSAYDSNLKARAKLQADREARRNS